jgi:hypothetical protein
MPPRVRDSEFTQMTLAVIASGFDSFESFES